jgi:hypothetical protein
MASHPPRRVLSSLFRKKSISSLIPEENQANFIITIMGRFSQASLGYYSSSNDFFFKLFVKKCEHTKWKNAYFCLKN